eukprot:GHVU01007900.1.p1 GENE.GHVU01007900.1~~GHVU01007900.1.p1  ORF type:complete len:110 (+),score=10.86 GHVU01007900.1:112-441(+)
MRTGGDCPTLPCGRGRRPLFCVNMLVFLQHTAREAAVNIKYGMCLTSDLFYKSPALPSTLDTFAKAKVDVVEMETATLFVVAKVRGVRAGAILVVDGSPLKVDLVSWTR